MRNSGPAERLGDILDPLLDRWCDRPAVSDERTRLTFGELQRDAEQWATAFAAHGVTHGTTVGLLAANSSEWLVVAMGAWRAGATLVPISTFVTARELNEIVNLSGIEVLVVQPSMRERDFLKMATEANAPALRTTIVLNASAEFPNLSRREFLRQAAPVGKPVDPDAVACVLYTSGTTGQSKGVELTHRAILSTVGPTALRSGLDSTDSLLSSLPLFWVAGLVIRALPTLAAGCELVLMEAFDVEHVLTVLATHRPTALHLRPPQVAQLLAHSRFDPMLLANVRNGNGRTEWFGGHLNREARFITGYGMTEMSGYVTSLDARDSDDQQRTQLGRPLPGVEIRIVNEAGEEVPRGSCGEIRVRGPGLFRRYRGRPAGVGLDEQGFFLTGDLGSIDERGTLSLLGRTKDLLRIKGINVSPLEVESVLAAHPGVEAAYVVGLPCDGFDQRLGALIVRSPAGSVTVSEIDAYATVELSHYKRPEFVLFISRDEVPLGGTVKPQRTELAKLAESRLRGVVRSKS